MKINTSGTAFFIRICLKKVVKIRVVVSISLKIDIFLAVKNVKKKKKDVWGLEPELFLIHAMIKSTIPNTINVFIT